jgi:hypothetical protein
MLFLFRTIISLTVDWNVKGVSQENRVLRVGGQHPLVGHKNWSDRLDQARR